MPIEEMPIALDAGHGSGHSGPTVRGYLQELFEGLVGRMGQFGQPVPVGHWLENLPGDELAELDLALLVAGGTEALPLKNAK